jgi:cardiolipin synthase
MIEVQPFAPQTQIRLLDTGATVFATMLSAIRAAERDIHLEVYAFSPDGVGGEFIAALTDASQRGVKVQVVLDGWGTGFFAGRIVERLSAAGCAAEVYNPLLQGFFGRFRRNHRKLLLVDDRIAILGGINIKDEFLGPRGWADVAVEICGPACASLGRRLRREPQKGQDPLVRIYISGIGGGRRLRRCYLKAFGAARSRVVLAHSYFLPDRGMLRSLTAAARRGVAVTLLVPGRSDVPLARLTTALLYRRLLMSGVRVFEWGDSILHAKLAVIDGERLLVGSFNLDPFSMVDLESLVEARVPAAAQTAESWISDRVERARPITLPEVERRTFGTFVGGLLGLLGRLLVDLVRRLLDAR